MNNWGPNDMLVVAAFRYTLNRRSYLPGAFIDWMKENWDSFLPQTKDLIQKEIHEELNEELYRHEWGTVLKWSEE